jgi:hypothetical protein
LLNIRPYATGERMVTQLPDTCVFRACAVSGCVVPTPIKASETAAMAENHLFIVLFTMNRCSLSRDLHQPVVDTMGHLRASKINTM